MINPFKEINWKPDAGELRKFAISLIIGFPCIATIFFLAAWLFSRSLPAPGFFLYLGGIGSAVGLICLLVPVVARPLYGVWYGLAACIGIVVANLLFTLLFYLLYAPLGLIMRVIGRDALSLRFKRGSATYWKDAPPQPPAKKYFRQF